MSDDTDAKTLARDVMLRLMDVVAEFERAGHDRKHVSAAIRYAMEPVPISDEQLEKFVTDHLDAAAASGPVTYEESRQLVDWLLDAGHKAGVAPSRVHRIIHQQAEERPG